MAPVLSSLNIVVCPLLFLPYYFFWQQLWNTMALSRIISQAMAQQAPHVALQVQKYIQIMVVNRCVDPLSKLGATRRAVLGRLRLSLGVQSHARTLRGDQVFLANALHRY
jgi:hypothetical protein